MKKLFLLSLLIIPLISFSQGKLKKQKINWISLEKAEEYSSKYNQPILIFFYKEDCPYCDRMKKETLNNPEVINLINTNFLPVRLDGYTKDIIVYNKKIYGNQQDAASGRKDWRHDFYFELGKYNESIITPTIVIMNSKHQKVEQFTGFQPKVQFLRGIKKLIK